MSEPGIRVPKDERRFAFGRNWRSFLGTLDHDRIQEAERLDGKRFLDVGSGSGLFSLAARRLGAEVWSALDLAHRAVRLGCNEFVFEKTAAGASATVFVGARASDDPVHAR